jgi:Ca2+/Na+ antiporter
MAKEPQPKIPAPTNFDRFEIGAIIALIAVFIGLFIWLTLTPDQQIYQYYAFALLSTLVLSGILKAVGAYKVSGVALGGSIVIFGVFFYLTKGSFESHDTSKADLSKKDVELAANKKQLSELNTEMNGLRVQLKAIFDRGLVIYTYRAGDHSRSDQSNVFVQYFGKNGEPRTAEKEGPSKHTIRWNNFEPSLGIQFITDQSAVPAERAERTDSSRAGVTIDHISYSLQALGRVDRFDPVALDLQTYLRTSD